jgi:MFS family permease
MAPVPFIFLICFAQVLGMAGNATFPALLPTFQAEWNLSNTEAGWISGVYYGGYAVIVPFLVASTDRRDPAKIYLVSSLLGGFAALGFAFLAEGLWTAVLFRLLGGVSLAGTYMVGLKLLTDRISGETQSRGVAWYTATFALGSSVSILLAGEMAALGGWRLAYAVAGGSTFAAAAMVWTLARIVPPLPEAAAPIRDGRSTLNLLPALRNRKALGFNLGYACHVWELFSLRAWFVAYFTFALALHGLEDLGGWTPTQVVTAFSIIGLPASVLGNEAALRFGRRPTIVVVMLASAVLAVLVGFGPGWPLWALLILLTLYSIAVMGDSAALTSGAVAAADPQRRGATMAVHSLLGFTAGFLGPLAFGGVLDLAGGEQRVLAWGLAFTLSGVAVALGPLLLWLISRKSRAV